MASVRHAVLQKSINPSNLATLVENIPLSFLRGGYLRWAYGLLGDRRSGGYYWSGYSLSGVNSRALNFNSTVVAPRSGSNHGYGFALRELNLGLGV